MFEYVWMEIIIAKNNLFVDYTYDDYHFWIALDVKTSSILITTR